MSKFKILSLIIVPAIIIGIILGLQLTVNRYKDQLRGTQLAGPQEGGLGSAQGGQGDLEARLAQAERDEYGCITELNYIWDPEIEVCIRFVDIPEDHKTALKAAVAYAGEGEDLRVRDYKNRPCDTCYKVKMAEGANYFTVRVKDGEVVDSYEESGESRGIYTTTAELMYQVSSSLLGLDVTKVTFDAADVVWNDGVKKYEYSGLGKSLSDTYGSTSNRDIYDKVVSSLEEIGFITSDDNPVIDTQDYKMTVLSDRDTVCNVSVELVQVENTSTFTLTCAEF